LLAAERHDVMPKNEEAPPVIDSSLVRAFAPVQPDVAFTGKQCVIVGGVEAGPGSRVVVAFNQRSGAYLLLLCNDSWESFAAAAFTTIEEALREAELWYDGISKYWVLTNYSVEEDRQHLEAYFDGEVCSFCGALPNQVNSMFEGNGAWICDKCVVEFAGSFSENKDN